MSTMQIRFSPLDTLFFRDGSPYNRNELQANVTTVFPPSPTSLAGAVRAAWARVLGWDGQGYGGNWDSCCKEKLGAGYKLPPSIRFNGPYLFYQNQPVFPAPAHLLAVLPDDPAKETPSNPVLLTPGAEMKTDMGSIRIPVKPAVEDEEKNLKPLSPEWWITVAGMQKLLNHEPPAAEDLIHQSRLWKIEQRIGNYRETGRVTGLMALYAPSHVRLENGVELAMFVSGLPDIDDKQLRQITSNPMLTGGEARACWLSVEDKALEDYFQQSNTPAGDKYTLIALTPVQMEQKLQPNTQIAGATLVSCCNQRPIMLGGWDRQKPRKLVPCLRAGTTLFMEHSNGETEQSVGKLLRHGAVTEWGFGRFITGIWK